MMDMLRDKDTLIKVRGSNHQKLLDQLNDMVVRYFHLNIFNYKHQIDLSHLVGHC